MPPCLRGETRDLRHLRAPNGEQNARHIDAKAAPGCSKTSPPARLHAREAERRAPADRADGRRVHRRRRCCRRWRGSSRRTGRWRARSSGAAASSACSAPTSPRRSAASTSTRPRAVVVGEAIGALGLVRDDVRRADRARDHAASSASAPTSSSSATCRGSCRGEIVGAYALSESGSGSDALGARARATRQADGSFVLTGEKMWITNGGFADLFIVFAKVDGEQFTAFIVERGFPGVTQRQGRAQDGPARLVDDAADPAGRAACRRRTCSARSARATRSRSTCSTTAASSSAAMCSGGAQRGDRRGGDATRRSGGSSASRSPPSARSGTSSPR